METGEDPPGVTIRAIRWRNPARKRRELRVWLTDEIDTALQSLNARNFLASDSVNLSFSRKSSSLRAADVNDPAVIARRDKARSRKVRRRKK
jgi:hypothetical protein